MRVTRRGLQLALAALWLLDGALQFQPFMLTRGFAHDVIAPAVSKIAGHTGRVSTKNRPTRATSGHPVGGCCGDRNGIRRSRVS